jgi:hypothetical protein
MLVLHDDAEREYAYGPALHLPDTKIGTFTQALYDEAKQKRLERRQYEIRLEADFSVPVTRRFRNAWQWRYPIAIVR